MILGFGVSSGELSMISHAKKVAARSQQHFKHAAVVFKGGAVVGYGVNDACLHAEVNALHSIDGWVDKRYLTLLSIRITPTGVIRCARPCPACVKFMREHGVHTVLFSNEKGEIERMRL